MPRLILRSLLIAAFLLSGERCCFASNKILETRFATIHYADDQEINDLFWRISGKRLLLTGQTEMIKNRLDELVERVEQALEMYPPSLHFGVELRAHYVSGAIAEYFHRTKAITVSLDRVTDGVLAHEMAHAVICAYFPVPPPEKAQEILAQYVDKHLYEEPI